MSAYPIHPAADLMPMLGESDLDALAADIRANGLHEPVVLFDGQVLDGRNRLAACHLAGVEPTFRTLESCADPVGFVLSVNVRRRHLSTSQLAMVGGRVARSLNLDSGRSDETAAKMVGGVERASVAMAISVLKNGAPELIALVDRNDLAVSVAAKAAKFSTDQQRELVAKGPEAVREAVKAEVKPREGKAPAPPSDTAAPAPAPTTPAPAAPVAGAGLPPQHPAVAAIASAPTRDALDAAYTAANGASLPKDAAEEAGKVYQRKVAELRAQAPAVTPAASTDEQVDLFTQAVPVVQFPPAETHGEKATKETSPAPVAPATVPASDAAEIAALRAEVESLRAANHELRTMNAILAASNEGYQEWVGSIHARIDRAPETVKGTVNLDRVRKLVELAGSPSENEARNAAMLACRYIRDHRVRLVTDNPLHSSDPMEKALRELHDAMRDAGIQP